MINFSHHVIHEDSDMTVSVIDESSRLNNLEEINDIVSPVKCYRLDNQGLRSLRITGDIVIVVPKHKNYPEEVYDYSLYCHYHHRNNLVDYQNQSVSALALRQSRPDLVKFFDLPELAHEFVQVPLLGFHFDHTQAEERYQQVLDTFRSDTDLIDSILPVEFFWGYSVVRNIKPTTGNLAKLSEALRFELSQSTLLQDMIDSLTIELLESRFDRSQAICEAIKTWLDNTKFYKIVNRLDPDASNIMLLLTAFLTKHFNQVLDEAILKVIRTK
jgi:hypothetical protein